MNEKDLQIYNRGIEEGKKHSNPSAATDKFINLTEKKIEIIDLRMESIKSDIKEIKESIKKSEDRFDSLIEKLDERYAMKTTETAVNRIGWLVISTVVLALLGLILVK